MNSYNYIAGKIGWIDSYNGIEYKQELWQWENECLAQTAADNVYIYKKLLVGITYSERPLCITQIISTISHRRL